jgi:hypothetical protein
MSDEFTIGTGVQSPTIHRQVTNEHGEVDQSEMQISIRMPE